MNLAPASDHMGCALNAERLRTEPRSKHKITLTGQTHLFANIPGSKLNPCERWQGAKFIGGLTFYNIPEMPNKKSFVRWIHMLCKFILNTRAFKQI